MTRRWRVTFIDPPATRDVTTVIEDVELAREFESHRARLRAIAHRMLGSQAEAEDAVQETWLRLSRTDTATIENLGAWLTTVVSRVCLSALRARGARREVLVDQVPDPVVAAVDDPHAEAELADGVGLALLVVLETLSPSERVSFVLHDLIAVARGAEHVATGARRFGQDVDLDRRRALVNGAPGIVNFHNGRPFSVMAFEIAGDRIVAIDILADRERLAALDLTAVA